MSLCSSPFLLISQRDLVVLRPCRRHPSVLAKEGEDNTSRASRSTRSLPVLLVISSRSSCSPRSLSFLVKHVQQLDAPPLLPPSPPRSRSPPRPSLVLFPIVLLLDFLSATTLDRLGAPAEGWHQPAQDGAHRDRAGRGRVLGGRQAESQRRGEEFEDGCVWVRCRFPLPVPERFGGRRSEEGDACRETAFFLLSFSANLALPTPTDPLPLHSFTLAVDFKLNFDLSNPAAIDRLHERAAKRLERLVDRNQGLYIKLAQSVALQAAVLPAPYREVFAGIFDNAPGVEWAEVERVRRSFCLFFFLSPS